MEKETSSCRVRVGKCNIRKRDFKTKYIQGRLIQKHLQDREVSNFVPNNGAGEN